MNEFHNQHNFTVSCNVFLVVVNLSVFPYTTNLLKKYLQKLVTYKVWAKTDNLFIISQYYNNVELS